MSMRATTPAAIRLRELCEGYPEAIVVNAVRNALRHTLSDEDEIDVVAALLWHWLDSRDGTPCPPVTDTLCEAVRDALVARAH